MQVESHFHNSITTTSMDEKHQIQNQDLDLDLDQDDNKSNDQNILNTEPGDRNLDLHLDQLDQDDNKSNDQNILNTEQGDRDLDLDIDGDINGHRENIFNWDPVGYNMDNNPPESYAVCESKVADWLERNTFMERKASVKFACSKNLDPCQIRSSRRSVSLNQKPKLAIIGFRKKQIHQNDGKSRHNDRVDNVRLFRNRSEPGRDYCLLITEPVSPRVSCVGRVGSMRVQGRKAGVWRSFKAAFSNLVQTNRVAKIAA